MKMKEEKVRMPSFQFNKSAEFYKLKTELQEDVLEEMKISFADKCDTITEMKKGTKNELDYHFFAFKKNRSKPSFCTKDMPFLQEQKSGYFLVINNKEYAAILKQNILLPQKVKDCFESINYDDFIKFNVQKNTEYKYLNMRNTDGADYAIRTKTFEGNDLKKNISSVSSNRYAIQTMRGKTGDKSFSLNFGTSRLNNYCSNNSLNDVCDWVKEVFANINSRKLKADESFLGNFAKKSKFTNFKDFEPSSILINLSELNRLLEIDDVEICKNGKKCNRKLFSNYEKIIDVQQEGNAYVANIPDAEIILSENKSRIIVSCQDWRDIELTGTPDSKYDGTFESFINDNNFFSIYFKDKQDVYMNGSLYQDNKLLERVDSLLSYMSVLPELEKCQCEKYEAYEKDKKGEIQKDKSGKKIKIKTKSLKKWDDDSEFNIVEKNFKGKFSCLICDDCENEWADYIGINSDGVEFFACKYKNVKSDSSSASYFQDVVGQALKNLGNFIPSDKQLEEKENEWKDFYLDSENIKRVRKGTIDSVASLWIKGITNPNYKKTFSLVVNFIKRDSLKKRFKNLKEYEENNGKKPGHAEETYQQLWILSNFVNSCLEQGITPKIYCT